MSELTGNIVLCGFMGCGKTSVGKRLARVMDRPFVDLDQYIEERQGLTVREIFARDGEEGFRRLETRAVEEIAKKGGMVVACGGGTVLFPRNVRAFRRAGSVILLLDVPLPLLHARLKNDTRRPLLQVEDRDAVIDKLYRERIWKYRRAADVRVRSTQPPWVMARRIAAMAQEGFPKPPAPARHKPRRRAGSKGGDQK